MVLPIGVAILLHIASVTYVGGDFMSGRMFAAPLLAAVVVLIHADVAGLFVYAWMPVVLAAVIGGAAFRAIAVGQGIADANDVVAASGVSDERAYYFRSNGLIAYSREAPYWPRSKWIENGIQTRSEGARVIVYCCNGMLGYAAGPSIHIVDTVGLGDPLMARLPSRSDWRIGHFGRDVPRAFTSGPCWLLHLVAITSSSRWPLIRRPRISSDLPLLYSSAVSKKLMPASRTFLYIEAEVASSASPPKDMVPKQSSETEMPVRPRSLVFMDQI